MSDAERAEYDAAAVEAEARLQLAELVYNALTAAGLSQTELARGGLVPARPSSPPSRTGRRLPEASCSRGSPTRSAARSRFASLPSPGGPAGAGSVGATGAEAGCRKRSAQGQTIGHDSRVDSAYSQVSKVHTVPYISSARCASWTLVGCSRTRWGCREPAGEDLRRRPVGSATHRRRGSPDIAC